LNQQAGQPMQSFPPSTHSPDARERGARVHRVTASLSFRARLLLIVGAVTLLTQAVQSVLGIREEAHRLQDALVARAEAATRQAALSLATAVWELNRDQARQILFGLALDADFHSAVVSDKNGVEFVRVDARDEPVGAGPRATREIRFDRLAGPERIGTLSVMLSADRVLAQQRAAILSRSVDAAIHIAAVLIATLLGVYLITRPMEAIAASMLRVAQGESGGATPHTQRGDQLGALARAVDMFRSEIRRRKEVEQELRAAQSGLEARISERTAELRALNAQLVGEVGERKRAEAAVRESEQRLRGLLEHIPASVVLKGANGRILLANNRFAERYGRTEGEVVGVPIDTVLPTDIAQFDAALDRDLLASRRAVTRELEAQFPDGQRRTLDVLKFLVLDDELGVAGIGTIAFDVTERKRLDDRLREAQKLESIGQLTGGIAHDFNNLLTVVLGNIEMAREQGDPAQVRRLLDAALGGAQRGAGLTRQLLAFARRQPLVPRTTDINRLIHDMSHLLARTLGETIVIDTALAADLWTTEVDPHQLESALLNLAINARDAMPRGGSIVIETANVRLDAAQAGETITAGSYVMARLRDTGSGMSAEVLARAFEPFFTTKEVGRGTGLGLSMVYGFVRQSGGDVRVESRVGHGTVVTMYLPKSARAVEVGVDDEGHRPSGTERILVVEDDPDVCQFLVTTLIELGYRVHAAGEAHAALSRLDQDDAFDLLLTDVILPGGMTGRDLSLATQRLNPAMRTMYVSGYPRDALMRDGRLDENLILLSKPFTRGELAQAVRRVLDTV
jgi:PAS domain S-box-containing protein